MKKLLFIAVVFAVMLSACQLNYTVWPNQTAVLTDGGKLLDCATPGNYWRWGLYEGITSVSVGTITFDIVTDEAVTRDNQLVGVTLTVQARRNSDCESVKNILTNWPTLVDDANLETVIGNTAHQSIKTGLRLMTLDELLNNRDQLASDIDTALKSEAYKYDTEIISTLVTNISLDPKYVEQLNQNSLLTAQIQGAVKQQELAKAEGEAQRAVIVQQELTQAEQTKLEAAKTETQLEIAKRNGEIIAAQNAIYTTNPQAFELARLAALQGLLKSTDKIYFIPEGTDLTTILAGQGVQVAPITSPDNSGGR